MKNKISYEWDVEEIDSDGDIIDHNHADKLSSYKEIDGVLVLVRDVGNSRDGVIDRSWAYVLGKKLPEYFTDTDEAKVAKVPQKFHDELAKYFEQSKSKI